MRESKFMRSKLLVTLILPFFLIILLSTGVYASQQTVDLKNWKLTLPTGSPGKPSEITQPKLNSFQNEWFKIDEKGAMHFRTPVNGITTKRSSYPRSELREMTNGGKANASWSSKKGTHTLFLEEAIISLPQTKKHIVAGQIHDAKDDILVVRLESSKLWINVDGKNVYLINANYKLGERFSIKFVVNGGQSQVFYNKGANPVYTLKKSYSGAYFKAGAYPQSNCSKEASALCNEENFGEVIIYKALVTHE